MHIKSLIPLDSAIHCHTCKKTWTITNSYDQDYLLTVYHYHWNKGHRLEIFLPEEFIAC